MTYVSFIKKSLTPLILVHVIVAVIAAGFFLSDGHWRPLWPGILAFSLSGLIFPFLLFPAALFTGLMQIFQQHKPITANVMMVCSLGYLALIMVLLGFGSFMLVESFFGMDQYKWVAYFWAASSTVAILGVFATRDRDSILFIAMVWFLQFGVYGAGYFEFIQGEGSLSRFFWMTYAVVILGVTIQSLIAEKFLKKKSAPASPAPTPANDQDNKSDQ